MANTLSATLPLRAEIPARSFRLSKKSREDVLRARAGAAYGRIQAQGSRLAQLLGVADSTITNRKAGAGGLANVLIEVDAWEPTVDTTPLLEALLVTQAEAQSKDQLCLSILMMDEQEADSAEDRAQIAYLTGTGTLADYSDALSRYLSRAMLMLRAVAGAR